MQLIIVRHGETDWTISGQHTGKTELTLTEHGRLQAASLQPMLGYLLNGESPVVYSSPRRRTIETAGLALPGADPQIEPLVAEFDYGIYEGMTFDEIRAVQPTWDIWRDGCPGGESTDDVGSRADQFLRSHVDGVAGPVIVFTHGHFSRILAARAIALDPSDGARLVSSPASISVIEESRGQPCIGVWNASADLFNERR